MPTRFAGELDIWYEKKKEFKNDSEFLAWSLSGFEPRQCCSRTGKYLQLSSAPRALLRVIAAACPLLLSMGTGPTPSESFRLTFSPKPAFSTVSSLVRSSFCLYARFLCTCPSFRPPGPQLHFCPYPLHPVPACCCCLASKLCPAPCNPVDCSLPGSSVYGIFQAGILEWVAISFSRGTSWPRDQTRVSRIGGRRFTVWATREATCSIVTFKSNNFPNVYKKLGDHFHYTYICASCVYWFVKSSYFLLWTMVQKVWKRLFWRRSTFWNSSTVEEKS